MMRNTILHSRWSRALLFALCFSAILAIAQSYPPPYPRKNAKSVLSNDRVDAWEVTWPKGEQTPLHEHRYPQLSVTLLGGSVQVTKLGQTPTVNVSQLGSVLFTPKGTIHVEEGLNDAPQRKIMLEIKPSTEPPVHPMNGIQGAFPREGAVKLFENDVVIAWDYTWKTGQTAPRHVDNYDSVTVFLGDGTIRSVSDQGGSKEATRKFGEVVYTARGMNAHTEEAVNGPLRAVIVQMK
jgi:quercetin dioxygenase-like cupin family protein